MNDRTIKRQKRTVLSKKFNINYDQFQQMLIDHNNVCGICNKPEYMGRGLSVDYCHSTNRIRGLLCSNCNRALGQFTDSTDILKSVIEYLERDYSVPNIADTIGFIEHGDRKRWMCFIDTPGGKFSSYMSAARHYNIDSTTIRLWCLEGKSKKEGYRSEKLFISQSDMDNKLKE